MTTLISRIHGPQSRTEAQAFFAEGHPFPLPGAMMGLVVLTNVAATIAMLLPL